MLQRRDVGLLGAKADGRGFGEPVASHQYHHVPLCPIICQQHSAQMGRFLQVDIRLKTTKVLRVLSSGGYKLNGCCFGYFSLRPLLIIPPCKLDQIKGWAFKQG